MAVPMIPNIVEWTIVPQKGTTTFYDDMNVWLAQTNTVVNSWNTTLNSTNAVYQDINFIYNQIQNADPTSGYSQAYTNRSQIAGYSEYKAVGSETSVLTSDNTNLQIYKNDVLLILITDYTLNVDGVTVDLVAPLTLDDLMQWYDLNKLKNSFYEKSEVYNKTEANDLFDDKIDKDVNALIEKVTQNGNDNLILSDSEDNNDLKKIPLSILKGYSSNRSTVQYRSAHEVRINGGLMSFDGFRFKGQYQKKGTKSLFQEGSKIVNSNPGGDLAFNQTTRKQESWYAIFACANASDTAITYVTVPYLRLHSAFSASIWYLSENTGEGKHSVGSTHSYDWVTTELIGNDILICSETIDGRPNAMSGRITTINNAGSNSIGFDVVGDVAALDYVLPAPNFDHYRYCGSFYEDTAEVRNIADSGSIVVSRGIAQQQLPASGAIPSSIALSVAGYICPLATAVKVGTQLLISTTGQGQYLEDFLIDNVHNIDVFNWNKTTASTSNLSQVMEIPFSFKQEYWWRNAGISANRTSGQHNIYGWIEG